MRGPLDVSQQLLASDVPFEVVHLPRRIATAEELPDVLGLPPATCLVIHLYETERGRVAVGLPAGSQPSLPALARATGSRVLGLASPSVVSAITEFLPGFVAPIALPDGIPLIVDARLGAEDVLCTTAGDPRTALRMRSVDLLRVTGARTDALTVPTLVPMPQARVSAQPHSGEPAAEAVPAG